MPEIKNGWKKVQVINPIYGNYHQMILYRDNKPIYGMVKKRIRESQMIMDEIISDMLNAKNLHK